MASLKPFFYLLFLLALSSSVSQAIVPPNNTFQYVNQGEFGEYSYITEYFPDYRPLPPFTNPFQLCFYNTTPNAYTLALRMGTRRTQSLMRWVWEANRGNAVRENATFSLGRDGNLVLADADGRVAWQTNTADKGVVRFEILPNGNLVLLDRRGKYIWQSFDSPTDTLLLGQSLRVGGVSKIVSRASVRDNVDGPYSFVIEPERLAMYYTPKNIPKPMVYWTSDLLFSTGKLVNLTFQIVETDIVGVDYNYIRCTTENTTALVNPDVDLGITRYNSTLTYLRLGFDGNIRVFTYRLGARSTAWDESYTFFNRGDRRVEGECQLPERCGKFGLCEDSQCVGCPSPNGIFAWSRNCDAKKVKSCRSRDFRYYMIKGVDHATVKYERGMGPVKRVECESRCTKDCKCMGYLYHTNTSRCWIVYELMTLTRVGNSTNLAYIKTPIR